MNKKTRFFLSRHSNQIYVSEKNSANFFFFFFIFSEADRNREKA
jgi:hypothetical protein